MALVMTDRRYYYRAAINLLEEGRSDLALDVIAKRNAITPAPFGACPAKKALAAVISPEFDEEIQETVYPYQGLDDLAGVDEDELYQAGLEEQEVNKVLSFLAGL